VVLTHREAPAPAGYEPRVLEIAQIGEDVLNQVAQEVDISNIAENEELQRLFQDMIVTMHAAQGIGLAAPQIRRSLRIIVFFLPASRDDNGVEVPLTILINPVIEPLCEDTNSDWEGCLSVKDKRGRVARFNKIRYSGYDASGAFIEQIAEGWHARLVQHEYDHLQGVLYPTIMPPGEELMDNNKWRELHSKK
jgi:peptide deformylase